MCVSSEAEASSWESWENVSPRIGIAWPTYTALWETVTWLSQMWVLGTTSDVFYNQIKHGPYNNRSCNRDLVSEQPNSFLGKKIDLHRALCKKLSKKQTFKRVYKSVGLNIEDVNNTVNGSAGHILAIRTLRINYANILLCILNDQPIIVTQLKVSHVRTQAMLSVSLPRVSSSTSFLPDSILNKLILPAWLPDAMYLPSGVKHTVHESTVNT